jgi:hypothetical protein
VTARSSVRTSAQQLEIGVPSAKAELFRLVDAAKKLSGDQPFRYRFSSAGEPCLRALVYDARDADDGVPPPVKERRLRDQFAMACGNAVGAHLESAARTIGWNTQSEHVFDTSGVRITGSSDILAPKKFVLDVKLVGEKSWARRPHDKHILQVNGYAVADDIPLAGLIYVRGSTIFDAESPEVELDLIEWAASVEIAQDLCATWLQVEQHRRFRTLPERFFGARPDGFPCAWCRHLERCAPPKEEEE